MNQSRCGIISSDNIMSSTAPTTCSRTYRTVQVVWRRRVCESRTAPRATPRHENHARCCVWVSLCGSDLRFTVETQFEPQIGTEGTTHLNCARMGRTVLVLKRNHNHKSILKSKRNPKTQNGLWCQFFCENVNIPKHQTRSITMKTVELDNGNVKHNEIQ